LLLFRKILAIYNYEAYNEQGVNMRLKDKVAIVTGAGRGIGKAIALAYAHEGANVVTISRTLSEIENTSEQIRANGRRAIAIRADVSNSGEVEDAVSLVIKEFGKVDILVNAAGIQGPIGPVVENDVNQWIQTVHVNLIGTFLCVRAVLPTMIKQGCGKIINFSGGGATSPRPYFTAYAASKGAVVHFTESLAEELKKHNVQVNAIAPGAVNTDMLNHVIKAGLLAGERELTKAHEQLKKGGTPLEKPVGLAIFLGSEDSGSISGKLISAVWDDLQNMAGQISQIMSSEIYTLRRVVK
jgi:NAD(P)-dependent dehydrogenase (short-subunit alcohol dehydrogenase family)